MKFLFLCHTDLNNYILTQRVKTFLPLMRNGLSGRPRTPSLLISQVAHLVRTDPGDWGDQGYCNSPPPLFLVEKLANFRLLPGISSGLPNYSPLQIYIPGWRGTVLSSVKFCIQIMITDLISHVYTRFSIDFKVVLFPLSALGTFMCQKLSKYATKFVGQFKRKKKQVLQVHVSILWASSFSLTFFCFFNL